MDLKPNVASAPQNNWVYLNLIHSNHCQNNFPNVYKTYRVTVQSKSCFFIFIFLFSFIFFIIIFFHSTGFCKSDGQCYLEL